MRLLLGDKGPEVQGLQRALNRIGSMLLVDGDFGGMTERAVVEARSFLRLPAGREADDALLAALRARPEPSRELTAPGVTYIAREEVSSPDAYRRKYLRPVLPPEDSGITIGIGYDLRFSSRAKLDQDWGGLLSPAVKDRLARVCGRKGTQAMLDEVGDIEIPLLPAMQAFVGSIMPEHVGHTRGIYPQLDALPAARRTALISLVFNRGPRLHDDSAADRRREMRQIQAALAQGRFDDVPVQLLAMRRLWDPVTARGLIERREREARLWMHGFAALQLD